MASPRPPLPFRKGSRRTLSITSAKTIPPLPVTWLWADRIALGTLCLLGGREQVGKSILAYTIAANITQGRLPGCTVGTPRPVLVVATEDSWEHTIVPRLMAADANLDLIYRLQVHVSNGDETSLTLPLDLGELTALVQQLHPALLILDPILSRLAPNLDTHKDAEVRVALEPLVRMADATQLAIIGLIHVNKSGSGDPLTLLMGSRAFAAVARSVLFVLFDPDDDTQRIRLMGQAKNNLGRIDLPTLTFTVDNVCVAHTPTGDVWTGQLTWLPDSSKSLFDAITTTPMTAGDLTAVQEAYDWLHDYLESLNGPADSAAVKRAGQHAGHTLRTLHRARERLHLIVSHAGYPRRTFWTLPIIAT